MTDYETIISERLSKRLILRPGHPPLDQLKMQFVMRSRMSFDPQNYNPIEKDFTQTASSQDDPAAVPRIGRAVADILDAVNEERLMLIYGDTSPYDILGFDDADPSIDPNWDFQLVSEDGTVWTNLIDAHISGDTA